MTQSNGRYLLSIEAIPAIDQAEPISPEGSPQTPPLPAYFVGSTAPNNVEDGVREVPNPATSINEIAAFLSTQEQPELLIAVHGYNTALGDFAKNQRPLGDGVKGWYQDIRNHIVEHCSQCSKGLVLIGYRWPSEQVKGIENDSLGHKLRYAHQSLPATLKVILVVAIALLFGLSIVSVATDLPGSMSFGIVGVSLVILATMAISTVLTLFLLRIVGYFRDSYRATNFGVPDLVEFIRQLDKAVLEANPNVDWSERRIKLSFIGHSMGGFVVTNAVRILSDVFDTQSIGTIDSTHKAKCPTPTIGNVFSLGRLVLVSPDIPAETIISGRANFLSSSLRRFEETYLFSNEGDMALKLASTAANYSSFPARTREGGYRLGNVVVRLPISNASETNPPSRHGIVNLDPKDGQLQDVQPREQEEGFEPKKIKVEVAGKSVEVSSFLEYLYILDCTSLVDRQTALLDLEQKPIAELFTIFDCTDYQENDPTHSGDSPKKVGVLSRALNKRSLNFWDYVGLTFDYFTGKIDTHGGYFYSGDTGDGAGQQQRKPEARFSKQLIYGLACLGFKTFLLGNEDTASDQAAIALQTLSQQCEEHGIQVLLSAERYNRDILGIRTDGDRDGY